MDVTGGCFCGQLRYEARIDLGAVAICHCRDCQIFSGSAFFTSARTDPADFRFTQGEPTYFEKVGGSGGIRRMAFCATCGSHICAMPGDAIAAQHLSLRIATSDQFDRLTPSAENFANQRADWLHPL